MSRYYGHPKATRIPQSVRRPYRDLAARWIETFRDHPTIDAACEEVKRIVLSPSETPPSQRTPLHLNARYLLWEEQRRLTRTHTRRRGCGATGQTITRVIPPCTPEEVLAAIIAVWCAVYYNPELLPAGDGAPLTFLLADAVFRLRDFSNKPYHKKPRTVSRSRIPGALPRRLQGTRLRDKLGSFLNEAVDSIEGWQAHEQEKKARLRQELPHVKRSQRRSEARKLAEAADNAPRVEDTTPVVLPPAPVQKPRGERLLDRFEWTETVRIRGGWERQKSHVAFRDHETGEPVTDATPEEASRAVTVTG